MGRRRRGSDAIAASVGPLLGRSTQRTRDLPYLFDEGRAGWFFRVDCVDYIFELAASKTLAIWANFFVSSPYLHLVAEKLRRVS